MLNPRWWVLQPKSDRTLKWKYARAVRKAKASAFLLPIALLCFATSFSQIHIHEKVDITKQTPGTLMKPGQPPAVVSGFVIPKGLRNRLQVYYSGLERLDELIPWYAKLKTIRTDTLGNDTTLYDMATEFRFPNLLANPETFVDLCGWWGENHYKLYYTPSAATEIYDVMRVVPRDTVVFGYITEIVGEGRTDTLGIFSADTVKLFEDSTIVGWNVSFADYNNCLNTWNEKMDVFVGLNCADYSPRLSQGDSSWRDSLYLYAVKKDTTYPNGDTVITRTPKKIYELGCALTSMAMVGQAFGLNVNPATLNSFMKTKKFGPRDSAKVKWDALDRWGGRRVIRHILTIGDGLDGNVGTPLPLDTLDYFLNRCYAVIAQVSNPSRSGRNHWVVVKPKNAAGRYPIVDPGYSDRPFLNDADPMKNYQNHVYRLSVYTIW